MMNSGARRLAMRSRLRADPASLAADTVALGALGLPLGVEEELPACLGIAGHVRLPGALARRAGQAVDVGDQLVDLVVLERLAQLLHGGVGDAVLDRPGDVGIGAAVDPASSVRSGPLPPRPAPPWQPLQRPRNSAWPSARAAGSGETGAAACAGARVCRANRSGGHRGPGPSQTPSFLAAPSTAQRSQSSPRRGVGSRTWRLSSARGRAAAGLVGDVPAGENLSQPARAVELIPGPVDRLLEVAVRLAHRGADGKAIHRAVGRGAGRNSSCPGQRSWASQGPRVEIT